MSKLESTKAYQGAELEEIFFRPMFTGPDAIELGVKVMYNMPVPTTLQFWKRSGDILQKYSTNGWSGGSAANRFSKTIKLDRVKAEAGYSAADYFNMVYELVTNRPDINMQDLTGTILEEAETSLFKEAIAESIRATMWIGDTSRTGENAKYNTFDGFLKRISADVADGETQIKKTTITASSDPDSAETTLKALWDNASIPLKECKSQDNLAYFVTSDIYNNYENALDSVTLESAYLAKQNGRAGVSYRGIPVIDVQLSGYLPDFTDMPQSFAILTDRRNLALAVNTADLPGTEVKMWYNPDMMENRQRAVFMAGCDYLLPELISIALPATE